MLKMPDKKRNDVEQFIRQHMGCICIIKDKDAVVSTWFFKFENKNDKMRVIQIRDLKTDEIKYELKKNNFKMPVKLLQRISFDTYCLVGKYKDSDLKRYTKNV